MILEVLIIKKFIAILSIILLSFSYLIVYINGRENYIDIDTAEIQNISIKYDEEIIECNPKYENTNLHIDISAKKAGKTSIIIEGEKNIENETEKTEIKRDVYVHKTGIITTTKFFGHCKGDISFIISLYIILILIIVYLIIKCKNKISKKMYSYENAKLLGMIIFISILTVSHITFFIYDLTNNYHESVSLFLEILADNIYMFLILVFPIAVILIILITISNIKLMKKEGKSWKNMLGVLLGGGIILIVTTNFLFNVIIYTNLIIKIVGYIILVYVSYLECLFVGNCILGVISAKHIPKFNKDAIIILGCQIRKDGKLTPLLKSRVDRAIEFSKMQKEEAGKNIIFVPSGGKGNDEIISESQAMKNYLKEQGIKDEYILIEDKSKNTYENIKFSTQIIKEKNENPNIAFSTTNYHVFRAGLIALQQDIEAEGIGSKTKSYYWINAFIREFVAILVSEKKSNIKTFFIIAIFITVLLLI